jgi:hypothetical protein
MIVRLLPEQVSNLWDMVKSGVVDFGVRQFPGNWELANNVFQRCLAGVVQIWICSDGVEGAPLLKGFYLTSIERDNLDGGRTLNLLLVYIFKPPSEELLQEAVSTIERYAASNSCKSISIVLPTGHREQLVERLWKKAKKNSLYMIPVEV